MNDRTALLETALMKGASEDPLTVTRDFVLPSPRVDRVNIFMIQPKILESRLRLMRF